MQKISDFAAAWDFLNTHELFRVYKNYKPYSILSLHEYRECIAAYEAAVNPELHFLNPELILKHNREVYEFYSNFGENRKLIEDHFHSESKFQNCLYIDIIWIDENGEESYIKTSPHDTAVFLLECGIKNGEPCHDYKLNCEGATFEEAVVKLANLVVKHYPEETGRTLKIDSILNDYNFENNLFKS